MKKSICLPEKLSLNFSDPPRFLLDEVAEDFIAEAVF